MAALRALSKAKTILLAISLISECNLTALEGLVRANPGKLHQDLVLRMLLSALPESVQPVLYMPILRQLITTSSLVEELHDGDIDESFLHGIPEEEARRRVRSLRLLPLLHSPALAGQTTDSLTLFLIHRAHRIDAQTGVLTFLPELILPFIDRSEHLRAWFISTLLPLLRLNYEYYPGGANALSLSEFEQLRGRAGVDFLLSHLGEENNGKAHETRSVGRDLRGLVGPWMLQASTRTPLPWPDDRVIDPSNAFGSLEAPFAGISPDESSAERSWQDSFDWLLSTAKTDFPLAVEAVEQWDGPGDVDFGGYEDGAGPVDQASLRRLRMRYAQAAMAVAYSAPSALVETLIKCHRLLGRVAVLGQLDSPMDLKSSSSSLPPIDGPLESIERATGASMLPNALMLPHNTLTAPSDQSISFLHHIILSAYLLALLGHKVTVHHTATLCLSASEEDQRKELQRAIHCICTGPKRSDQGWRRCREEILWLFDWGVSEAAAEESWKRVSGIFGRTPKAVLEAEFLKLLLESARECSSLRSLYISG